MREWYRDGAGRMAYAKFNNDHVSLYAAGQGRYICIAVIHISELRRDWTRIK